MTIEINTQRKKRLLGLCRKGERLLSELSAKWKQPLSVSLTRNRFLNTIILEEAGAIQLERYHKHMRREYVRLRKGKDNDTHPAGGG